MSLRPHLAALSLSTLVTAGGSSAQSVGWEEAISTVEATAEAYMDHIRSIDGTAAVGAAYHGWEFDRHRCAVLGRMLGHAEAIAELERLDHPPMTAESDTFELMVFVATLDSWVTAVRRALDAPEVERINAWNLECVGLMGIPASLAMESPEPGADFRVDGDHLLVYGDIEAGFHKRLVAALDLNPSVHTVSLGSAGGNVSEAIEAGLEIRRRGLDAQLHGPCYSACPLVFMGGARRTIWAGGSQLGFHQVYVGAGIAIPADDPVYRGIAHYLESVEVDSTTVIGWMMKASPLGIHEPEVEAYCRPLVATFVQRVCADGQLF